MSDPISPTTMPTARLVAVLASTAAGAIYLSIGLGLVTVGESTQSATTDLFAFGILMTAVSAVIAVLLATFTTSRVVLIGAAVVELIALVGYVAAWTLREPPFELWGVSIKVFQAIVVVAIVYLLVQGRRPASTAPGAHGGGAA